VPFLAGPAQDLAQQLVLLVKNSTGKVDLEGISHRKFLFNHLLHLLLL
jgi:hypothetical protein